MTTRYPKQLASNPLTNFLLSKIAEHDATQTGKLRPNESETYRRLVHQEAKRIGIRKPKHLPTDTQALSNFVTE